MPALDSVNIKAETAIKFDIKDKNQRNYEIVEFALEHISSWESITHEPQILKGK